MLVPDQLKKDLGKLQFGKPYNFTFTITNSGTEVVKINKLVVGCTSCTKANTKDTIIQPGKTGTINVVYTPGRLGKSNKNIQVIYSTTENLRLEFTADVEN